MCEKVLLKKDNSGNLRVVTISLKEHPVYSGAYIISRFTGINNGTITEQPALEIFEGKASRTVKEQAYLVYNANLEDYLDKGYKLITDYGCTSLNELTVETMNKIVFSITTDAKGIAKHMLAKTAFSKSDNRWNKPWLASYKIDGVRCSLFKDYTTNKLRTASRGGKDYDLTIKHILNDPEVISLFDIFPDLILDGELYIHGKPLSYISGLTRANVNTSKAQEEIRFYVFDIMTDNIFYNRLNMLKEISLYNNSKSIVFVEHLPISGYDNIMKLHEAAVISGYEGLVLRDPDKKYGYGTRDWRMIKVKLFEDAEFEIIGITEGLRIEDLVFVMRMPNGLTFEAKPTGTRELREWYFNNISTLIGKKGTVKYFGFGINGRPNLPVFKCLKY